MRGDCRSSGRGGKPRTTTTASTPAGFRPPRLNPARPAVGGIGLRSRSVLPQALAQCRSRITGSVPAAAPLSERPPTREMSWSAVEFAQLCLCNHDEPKWVVTARKSPRHAGACGGFTLVCYVAFTLPSRGPRRAASAWWPTADGSPSTKPGRRHRRCRSRRAPSPSWWCG
jgi:hypothetical protein